MDPRFAQYFFVQDGLHSRQDKHHRIKYVHGLPRQQPLLLQPSCLGNAINSDQLPLFEQAAPSSDAGSSDEGSGSRKRPHKTPWTLQEDQMILHAVQRSGCKWARIAETLPHQRTDDAVRNRWQRLQRKQVQTVSVESQYIPGAVQNHAPRGDDFVWNDPPTSPPHVTPATFSSSSVASAAPSPSCVDEKSGELSSKYGEMWTEEEDRIIDEGVRLRGLRWRAIAALLPGRTNSGCRNRWVRNQERLLASAGTPVQGAAEVLAALRKAGKVVDRTSQPPIRV